MSSIVFTLLLPEVKNRDPDLILADEIRAAREEKEIQVRSV